jgi:hypothetical protein
MAWMVGILIMSGQGGKNPRVPVVFPTAIAPLNNHDHLKQKHPTGNSAKAEALTMHSRWSVGIDDPQYSFITHQKIWAAGR